MPETLDSVIYCLYISSTQFLFICLHLFNLPAVGHEWQSPPVTHCHAATDNIALLTHTWPHSALMFTFNTNPKTHKVRLTLLFLSLALFSFKCCSTMQ